MILIRHNGMVPGYLTLFLMLVISFYQKKDTFKKLVCVSLIVLGCVFLIKGPVYTHLNVVKNPIGLKYVFPMHQIVTTYVNEGNISEEELTIINDIVPLEFAKTHYHMYNNNALMFFYDESFPNYNYVNSLSNYGADVLKLYIRLGYKNMGIFIKDIAFMTNLIWSPISLPSQVSYHYDHYDYNGGNEKWRSEYGLYQPNGFIKSKIMQYVKYSEGNKFSQHIIWRHSIIFWSLLILFLLLLWKRKYGIFIIFLPFWGNVLSLFISMAASDYRYVYPSIPVYPFLFIIGMYYLTQDNT